MARYGILSDVHGNLEALHGALQLLLDEHAVDSLVCLGDLVGYGAEPDTCVAVLEDLEVVSVTGNHDLVATGVLGFDRCALRPAFALRRTREVLSAATVEALRELPPRLVLEDEVVLVHGGIRDVCQYVTRPAHVLENDASLRAEVPEATLCFFGHTHERRLWEIDGEAVTDRTDIHAPDDVEVTLKASGRRYFINPGSVDAARKRGDRRAEVAIFDSQRRTVSFHRVAYDHESAERAAAREGYRMGPLEERLRGAARTLARKQAGAFRRLQGWWTTGGWARGGRSR